MNAEDKTYYDNYRRKSENTTCEFCRASKAVDVHHLYGRSGETKFVIDSGVIKTIRNGKLLIALCRHDHNLAHRWLTALRPLLFDICVERNPELLED